jgi:F420H(2)-dependent quinone reductase
VRAGCGSPGLLPAGMVVLETTGAKSGLPRRVPLLATVLEVSFAITSSDSFGGAVDSPEGLQDGEVVREGSRCPEVISAEKARKRVAVCLAVERSIREGCAIGLRF